MADLTVGTIKEYLETAVKAFRDDPADTDFQEGYQAALLGMYEDLFMTQEERSFNRANCIRLES